MPDSDGFEVDVEALYAASLGLRNLVSEFDEKPVRDIDAGANFGHAELSAAVEGFSNRWQRGAKNLIVDVEAIDDRLIETLKTYQEADDAALRALRKIYTGGGHAFDVQE
ncbi:hypothetical protein AB0H12_08735 [Actinosynnema sp. NPDC023794]